MTSLTMPSRVVYMGADENATGCGYKGLALVNTPRPGVWTIRYVTGSVLSTMFLLSARQKATRD